MSIRTVAPVAIFLAITPRLAAAEGTLDVRPLSQTDAPYGHLEYLPVGYANSGRKHPVVLFLHGAGESGDGETNLLDPMTAHGPGRLIEEGSTYFDDEATMVFMPQTNSGWNPATVHELLRYIATEFRVDPRRVYITGLSMGGGGTWSYVASHAGRVSAAVPICGAAGAGDPTSFVELPTWSFHAGTAPTVTRNNSIGWTNVIADAAAMVDVPDVLTGYPHQGADINQPAADDQTVLFDGAMFTWVSGVDTSGDALLRMTLYPGGGHDSWTPTYANVEMWDWFVAQQKPQALEDDTWIIDNLDAGFSASAPVPDSWTRSEDVAGFYWWDYHQNEVGADVSASFTAGLPAGRYEVYVSWSAGKDRSSAIEAVIEDATEAPEPQLLDMTQGGGFTSIGTFDFEGGTSTVTLRGADGSTGLLVADAVGFVPREDPSADTSGDGSSDDGVSVTGGNNEIGEEESASEDGPVDPMDTSGSGGTGGSDTTGAPGQGETDTGCGCTHRGGAGGSLALLVVLAARRRRARTR